MAAFMPPLREKKVYDVRRQYAAVKYKKLYRFSEMHTSWLAEEFLADDINYVEEARGGALSKKQKMEVFLRFLSDPGFQLGVGTDTGVSQGTVSVVIKAVSDKILEKSGRWIHFPSNNEQLREAKQEYSAWKRFPHAIGFIDCTHIRILKPSIAMYGDEFINRKGYPSINVQATVNAKSMFTSVDAAWPGSVHDSRILKLSPIYPIMANNNVGALLLGDEGYALTPWMMTPYRNPATPQERAYNRLHTVERTTIERVFGQLKRRFPMLNYKMRVKMDRIPQIIIAACVLHNAAKYLQDENDFPQVDVNRGNVMVCPLPQANPRAIRARGVARRNVISGLL